LRHIAKELPVVLPLHPRTRAKLDQTGQDSALQGLTLLDPVPYLEMQRLQMSARVILTDSGGLQKEAYFHQVPCITLRDETEWVETVHSGWNQLVGANRDRILAALHQTPKPKMAQISPYGEGQAARAIVKLFQ
jgi:UDP-GlcNAc3NAcA epimerase